MVERLFFLLAVLLFLTGCGAPSDVRDRVAEFRAGAQGMTNRMDEGKTTREQEQAYIRANVRAWVTVEVGLRG